MKKIFALCLVVVFASVFFAFAEEDPEIAELTDQFISGLKQQFPADIPSEYIENVLRPKVYAATKSYLDECNKIGEEMAEDILSGRFRNQSSVGKSRLSNLP